MTLGHALWSMFGSRVIIGTYLNVVYKLMLHTKYQGSRPGAFRKEYFLCFHYMQINIKKKVWPGNATRTHCIQTHGTVRKSQRIITAS